MKAMLAIALAACALVSGGCATLPASPTAEVRQAIAPTGKLRVALFATNAVHVIKDPATGQMKGVGHDLGRELAERLGVPFEPVLYTEFGSLLDGAKSNAWDVAFMGITDERLQFLEFTGRHVSTEIGFLVPPGSAIGSTQDVDRSGVRVAAIARGTPDVEMTRRLRNAAVVRVQSAPAALELLQSGKVEAYAALKPVVLGLAAKNPGARVLDAPGTDDAAMALPKGRGPAAMAYARSFIAEAKRDGKVAQAIERAGLKGVVVAPD